MFVNKIQNLPDVLYHYCSLDSFYKIVQSKCLWLTDARKSNDSKEIIWADEIVRRYIEEFKEVDEDVPELADVESIYRSRRVPYIASFSTGRDLLSQWRGYADNARGVSIGFDLRELKLEKILPNNTLDREGATGISAVLYDKDVQEHHIKMFFRARREKMADGLDLGIWLSQVSYIFKNPHFREEQEYRIIHTPFIASTEDGSFSEATSALSKISYFVRRGDLVGYFKLSFPKKNFIKEVVVGPSCIVGPEDIRLFLSSEGINDVAIGASLGSYKA